MYEKLQRNTESAVLNDVHVGTYGLHTVARTESRSFWMRNVACTLKKSKLEQRQISTCQFPLLPFLLVVFSMFDDVVEDVNSLFIFLSCKQPERVSSFAGKRYRELGLLAFRLFGDLQFLLNSWRPGKSSGQLHRLRVSNFDRYRAALAKLLNDGVRMGQRLQAELGEGRTWARHDGGAGRRLRRTAGRGTSAGLVRTDRRRGRAVWRQNVDRTGDERAVDEVLADVCYYALVGRVLRLRVDVQAKLADMWRRHSNCDYVSLHFVRHKPAADRPCMAYKSSY